MLGISNKKWLSIAFLLATIIISLLLSGIPFLISEKPSKVGNYEGFEGWQIPSKNENAGTNLSSPDIFPVQSGTETVSMSSSTPVMPGIAISGDFKQQLNNAILDVPTQVSSSTKQTAVFNNIFSTHETENFTTVV